MPTRQRLGRHSAPTAIATHFCRDGELGRAGLAAFLSEPRFDGLPTLLEGPGKAGKAVEKVDIERMRELRRNGLRSRKRRAKG